MKEKEKRMMKLMLEGQQKMTAKEHKAWLKKWNKAFLDCVMVSQLKLERQKR